MTLLAAQDLRAQAREWIDQQGWSQTTQPAGRGYYRTTITGPAPEQDAPTLQLSAVASSQEAAVARARLDLLHLVEASMLEARGSSPRRSVSTARVPMRKAMDATYPQHTDSTGATTTRLFA